MLTGSKGEPRYESLDVWRGVACLMVVLHHSGYFALGWSETAGSSAEAWGRRLVVGVLDAMEMGVPLFFVISGYCIAASMDGHLRRGASPWEFLWRRLRRIYPPYWASLVVFVAITVSLERLGLGWLCGGDHSGGLISPSKLDWQQWLGNVTLTETWRKVAWGGSYVEVFTRIAWSLCFEEQFYFVCFLCLLLAPRRLYPALALLTVAIVGFRVFAFDSKRLAEYRGTFLELWHEFAVGLVVYWRLASASSSGAKRLAELGLVGLFAVGWEWDFPATWVAAAFGLALISLHRLDSSAGRLGVLWPLRACGRRCYSIYLIHLPICTTGNELLYHLGIVGFWPRVFILIPAVSLSAVAAGWGFFAAVESRFLSTSMNTSHAPSPSEGIRRANRLTASSD